MRLQSPVGRRDRSADGDPFRLALGAISKAFAAALIAGLTLAATTPLLPAALSSGAAVFAAFWVRRLRARKESGI